MFSCVSVVPGKLHHADFFHILKIASNVLSTHSAGPLQLL